MKGITKILMFSLLFFACRGDERVEEGYYLPEYDVGVQILADDGGTYTAKVKVGLFSQKSEIIPCSLGQ